MRKTSQWTRVSALIGSALLVSGFAGCASSSDASGDEGAAFAACPPSASEEIEGDTIRAGTSGPLSGSFATLGLVNKAAKAYFDYYNKKGGIETVDGKKKVELEMKDDQYTSSKTQDNMRELVEKDDVSAIIATAGTAPAEAIAPYLNSTCVPQLFPASGAAHLMAADRPFTFQASSYADQAKALANFVMQKDKSATVAVLYQNDDVGKGILDSFEDSVKDSGIEIVAKESYEPAATSVKSQMTTLSGTEADYLLNASVGVSCTQALTAIAEGSWKPTIVMGNNCNQTSIEQAPAAGADDLHSSLSNQSPSSDTAAMKQFKQVMADGGVEPTAEALVGYGLAQLAAQAIGNAEELTPIGIAKGAAGMEGNPPADSITLPGTVFSSDPETPLISSYTVAPWDSKAGVFDTDSGIVVKTTR